VLVIKLQKSFTILVVLVEWEYCQEFYAVVAPLRHYWIIKQFEETGSV
jgi:hypothetical protein